MDKTLLTGSRLLTTMIVRYQRVWLLHSDIIYHLFVQEGVSLHGGVYLDCANTTPTCEEILIISSIRAFNTPRQENFHPFRNLLMVAEPFPDLLQGSLTVRGGSRGVSSSSILRMDILRSRIFIIPTLDIQSQTPSYRRFALLKGRSSSALAFARAQGVIQLIYS